MKDEATENSNESICRWTVHCRAFEIFHLVEVSQSKEIVNLLLPDQVCHQNYHRISRELSSSSVQFHSRLDCPVSMKKTSLLSIKGLEEIVKKRDLSDWRFGLIFSPSVCRVFVFVFSSTKLRNTIRHYSCKTTDWDRCYDWHNIDIVALDVEGKSSRIWLGIVSLQNTKIHTQFIHAIQFFSRSVILVKISIYFSKLYTAVGVVGRESHKAVKPLLETL